MRYKTLRIQGLGPFRELVELDIETLGGPLVAVTGANGAGKSTALELLVGALYRTTPTRGSLRDLATRRDAFVEVELGDGTTIRQLIDSVSGKGETLIRRGDEVLVESGKVRDGDAWIAKHLPPAELELVTAFGVQGSKGFAGLDGSKRKAILLRALGLERLEDLAKLARERARGSRARFEALELAIRETATALGDDADLRERMRTAEQARPAAEAEVEKSERTVGLSARRAELLAEELLSSREVERLETLRRSLDLLLASRPEIDAAVAARADAVDSAVELERSVEELRTACERRSGELKAYRVSWTEAKGRLRTLEREAENLRASLSVRERLERRIEILEDVRARAVEIEASRADCRANASGLRTEAAEGVATRLARLRTGLKEVEDIGAEDGAGADVLERVVDVAHFTLDADRERERRLEDLPGVAEKLGDHDLNLTASLKAIRLELGKLEADAARLDVLPKPDALVDVDKRLDAERATIAVALQAGEKLAPEVKADGATIRDMTARASDLRAQALGLGARANRRDEVVAAAGRLGEVDRNLIQARRAHEVADLALSEVKEALSVQAAHDTLVAARAALEALVRERGRVSGLLEASAAAGKRQTELEARRGPLEEELADWTFLGQSLGRDGLQAALIDAAGPELTELVNDLLHSCVGPRWSVEVRTTRPKASGKGEREVLDLIVVDTVEGREGEIATYSGGEGVILGEAVALALSTLARRTAGNDEGATIVRDESGAALDPQRAEQWVAMVRRAAELVGASKVLVVTHNTRAAQLCDSEILVANRSISRDEGVHA